MLITVIDLPGPLVLNAPADWPAPSWAEPSSWPVPALEQVMMAGYGVAPPSKLAWLCRRAADLLDQRGWVQGSPRDERGRMCAFEALVTAGTTNADLGAIVREMFAVIEGRGGDAGASGSIPRWNDAPGRTREEVTGVLRATADRLAAKPDDSFASARRGCECALCAMPVLAGVL